MNIHLSQLDNSKENCLVLIGGVGDPTEIFEPLVRLLIPKLANHSICTFTFSQKTNTLPLLQKQTVELEEVLDTLITKHHFKQIDLWCTSMGAYSTVKVITNPKYNTHLKHALFFDPADYYQDDQASNVDEEVTWSGYQNYQPLKPTISKDLSKISSNIIVDVTHLIVRNHNESGYIENKYVKRNLDNPKGCPRLNTNMVKQYYDNLPMHNRGEYQEINHIPHAIFRDGDISYNLTTIANQIIEALSK